MKKYPILTGFLIVISIALMLAAIDMWRTRNQNKTPKDPGKCTWTFSFSRDNFILPEWSNLFAYLTANGLILDGATGKELVIMAKSETVKKEIESAAKTRNWKYTVLQNC